MGYYEATIYNSKKKKLMDSYYMDFGTVKLNFEQELKDHVYKECPSSISHIAQFQDVLYITSSYKTKEDDHVHEHE